MEKLISSANSANKPYIEVTYTIPKGNTPTIKAYHNGDSTGYFDISWKKVEGAKGYKVWIYNGKEYQAISAGNVTSWSTKGKKSGLRAQKLPPRDINCIWTARMELNWH